MRPSCPLRHTSFLVTGLSIALTLVMGCAASEPAAPAAPSPTTEPAPSGPSYEVLVLDASGVTYRNLRTGRTTTLAAGIGVNVDAVPSPDRRTLALAYRRSDSTAVALIDVARGSGTAPALREVFVAPDDRTVTFAWSSTGEAVAFGFYHPRRDGGLGPGGVRIATVADGSVRDVGCSASKTVHAWLPDGGLLTGDGANLYVVDADGCGTRRTLDARTWHRVTADPTGRRLAFIFRDLIYDRGSRSYVPDSALMVLDLPTGEPQEVAGSRYRPRDLAWSPDGAVLAYSVQVPDQDTRALTLYDHDTERSTYLAAPAADATHRDARPAWSPDGNALAFLRSYPGDTSTQVLVYRFLDLRAQGLTSTPAGIAALQWAGEETLAVTPDGAAPRFYPLAASADPISLDTAQTVLFAAPTGDSEVR